MDEDCDCPEVEIPNGALYGEFEIVNKKGLHARATAKFVQCAARYEAFGAAGMASKITKVHSLEAMQKRYDKGELAARVA